MWIIAWLVSVSAVGYIMAIIFLKKLKETKNLYENFKLSQESQTEIYRQGYYNLLSEYNKVVSMLEFYKRNSNNVISDKEVKEAVKFAMKFSHPDKGNCKTNDEFIKFRELYNKLK